MEEVAVDVLRGTPGIVLVAIRGFAVFLFSLGVVYILGRMLEILKQYRTKNFIALVCMVGSSYFLAWIHDMPTMTRIETHARAVMYVAVAAIFYVLVGFDLYDRFNSWSDRKIAPAPKKPQPKSKTSTKRKPKA